MLMPPPECRKNNNMKIADRCFEYVTQLKYLETAVTNTNCIHE
jgi:hypothetical protein